MKKTNTGLLLSAFVLFPLSVFAAPTRTVVVEVFTGTWCQYCPGAARGVDALYNDYPNNLLAIEYHGGDVFENVAAGTRQSYYGSGVISGYPTAIFDGVVPYVGGSKDASLYFVYVPKYNARAAVEPPLTISLSKGSSYAAGTTGTVIATIKNVSSSPVSGTVHFTMTERHIPYKWQNMDTLDFVERAMLPDASGEAITLAPGETKVLSRPFTIDASWPSFTKDANIQLGCFVQGATKEIYQAAVSGFSELPAAVEENTAPSAFALRVPGVINSKSPIEFSLSEGSIVKLSLFDSTGRLVRTICSGSYDAGTHTVELSSEGLASGVYLISSYMNGHSELHKVVITH